MPAAFTRESTAASCLGTACCSAGTSGCQKQWPSGAACSAARPALVAASVRSGAATLSRAWSGTPCCDRIRKPLRKKRRRRQQDSGSASGGEEEEEETSMQGPQEQEAGARSTSLGGPAAAAKKRPRTQRQPLPAATSTDSDGGTQLRLGQQEQHQGSKAASEQRRCSQCGSTSPGSSWGAHWCHHPQYSEQWLCDPCRGRIYRQLKQQGRRRGSGGSGGEDEQQAAPAQEQQAVAAPAAASAAAGAKRRQERHPQHQEQQPALQAQAVPQHAPPAATHEPCGVSAGIAAGQALAGPEAGQQQQQQQQQQDVLSLLEAATEQAAAAAAGLTPELAAAFAMLPPLEARKVGGGWAVAGSGSVQC